MYRGLVLALLLAPCASVAAERSPEGVVQAFFGPSGIDDKSAYYTGEMLGFKEQRTLGETLPKGVSITTRSLQSTDSNAVLGVTLAKDGHAEDWYAYLEKREGQWRLEAVRTLALTGVPRMVLTQLEEKEDRTSEEEWMLNNLRLLFKSDAGLSDFVKSHTEELGKIVELISSDNSAALQEARALYIGSVEKTSTGLVKFTIGGMVDNSVGILWVPPDVAPPVMSSDSYILVEQVVGPWYLFKTT